MAGGTLGQTNDNDDTLIKGGTDGTSIGNNTNRLLVDGSSVTQPVSGTVAVSSISGSVTVSAGREKGLEYSSYTPDPHSYPLNTSDVSMDFSDELLVRGPSFSDEGSFRTDFTGSSLSTTLSGTPNFKNNNTTLTGGTAFTTEVGVGQYVKKSADAESLWTQVDFVESDTTLDFVTAYQGTTQNVTGIVSDWKTTTPSGGTITVGSSLVNLAPGTTSGNFVAIQRFGDYLPFILSGKLSITQRIANQTAIFGFQDSNTSPTKQAVVVFDGTDNTKVKFRTSSSAAASDIQETTVSLPERTTADLITYGIELSPSQATLRINGFATAIHTDHLPGPYDNLSINLNVTNSATVTATTFSADWVFFQNVDQTEVTAAFQSEPIVTKIADKPQTYSAVAVNVASAALATDIFAIIGSATKLIKITQLDISATQTTGGVGLIQLIKRSSADSGGTATTLTAVPHDSASAAGTAVAKAYTANPTLGTAVGTIRADRIFISSVTTLEEPLTYNFGRDTGTQPIMLRGVGETLAVNLNGATFTGSLFTYFVEWTEE